MEKNEISERKDAINTAKREASLIFDLVFFLLILIPSIALFYIYYKVFTQWVIFILALLILLFDFSLTVAILIKRFKKVHPTYFIANYDEIPISWFLSSILTIPFYYLTKSIIIAIIFYILFILGISSLGLRKIKLWSIILIIISLIAFYYAYKNRDIFLYVFPTFVLAYMFMTIGEHLGRNLENRKSIIFPSFMLIISLSISLFFIHFYDIRIASFIGLLASTFFGFFFLQLSLISSLKNILIHKKEDQQYVSHLILTFMGIILFCIFIFYKHNIYLYIGASLCLSFGILSLKLYINRYYPDEISRDISFSIGHGILGLTIVIFYFLFLRESFIFLIGIALIVISLRILYKTMTKAKLELEFNKKSR